MTDPITQSMMQGAAGASGAGDKYVNDVFNIDIYKGKSGVGIAITNGMDLTKPSMVVIKNRERASKAWWVYDNEANIKPTGDGNIFWNSSAGQNIGYTSVYNITRDAKGYVSPTTDDNELGANGDYYVSYSFKKKENFFDIVTYTGTGSLRTIAHNLGAVPAMIWVKQYGIDNQDWRVYHKDMTNNGPSDACEYVMKLSNNIARTAESAAWNNTPPTATHFTVNTGNAVNQSGQKYVAYLFADHNDGNTGTFGENEDQNIIACGRYTGNGGASGPFINLGWEPDWIMIKRRDSAENWFTCDQLQQMPGTDDRPTVWMKMDTTDAIQVNDTKVRSLAKGFAPTDGDAMINASGNNYIYCAIRRPELTVARPIESPTEVFDMDNSAELDNAGFPCFPVRGIRKVDMATARQYAAGENWYLGDRKMARDAIYIDNSNPRINWTNRRFDILNAWNAGWTTVGYQTWAWARNPGSFDIQYHEGNGNSYQTFDHNLGVVPEMIWVKRLTAASDWAVYHKGLNNGSNPAHHYMQLNEQQWAANSSSYWDNRAPNAQQYFVGSGGQVNTNGDWYLTYLFASKEGVSKCGYYSGNGATQSINFGFQPRFVLIKCSNANNTKWAVWDSLRGWNQCLDFSQTSAQTNFQAFTVTSTGITLSVGNGNSNDSGRNYIYYAHA